MVARSPGFGRDDQRDRARPASTPTSSYPGYGIPYKVMCSATPHYSVIFDYGDHPDPVAYPIPPNPLIEGGRIDTSSWSTSACQLYELFAARERPALARRVGGHLGPALERPRPAGWTCADAAGLPILPGLIRYDEVAAGAIRHALRFTTTGRARLHLPGAPPGRRLVVASCRRWACGSGSRPSSTRRLLAQARVIPEALKRYGMILADNGSPWYITGAATRA